MESNNIKTIDEYIMQFPADKAQILMKIRDVIRKAAPQAKEKISYSMPTFFLNGNLVHFAAHKNHIGFYPTPSAIEKFKVELAGYKSSKGAVQYPFDKPIPYDLISEIVKFRVSEVQEKNKA